MSRISVPEPVRAELNAMGIVVRELDRLDDAAKRRAMDYLWDRFVAHPPKRDA